MPVRKSTRSTARKAVRKVTRRAKSSKLTGVTTALRRKASSVVKSVKALAKGRKRRAA
jgi:hypothetical protein